ncbi:sensor histidine kinase [Brevibacillus migulae]|uniref:sensor histidine kinase n=1 Tax=Brevibacillus migulae TaxID=1644114 RepID=UPI00142FC07D|nr:GHKL domain-containing protein [Brevibacillus migulae]
MSFRTKASVITVIVVACVLLLNNVTYYISTKNILIDNLTNQTETIASQIESYIKDSQRKSQYAEQLLARQMRLAAIATKLQLDPKLENVTNEQLMKIRDELEISHITLFKRSGEDLPNRKEDIKGLRSTNEKERNLSSLEFDYWYTAFDQLLRDGKVTIPQGYKLTHFWSGPMDVTSSDPSKLNKFGYYHDNTTDYIINPYVRDYFLTEFQAIMGHDKLIQETIANIPDVLEISGFNPKTFGKAPVVIKQNNNDVSPFPDRPIYFGSYFYKDGQDHANVRRAFETDKIVTTRIHVNNKDILKSFIPVKSETYPYVISVVMDYGAIQETLDQQLVRTIMIIFVGTLSSIIILFVLQRWFTRSKDAAVQTAQEIYLNNLDNMFTMIRGQRHDLINHVNTIHYLATYGTREELLQYTEDLTGHVSQVNDIVRIGNPAIAAIVTAKIVEASRNKIHFEHELIGFKDGSLGVKTLDIVRIISNLIDNAFHEVMKLPEQERKVVLKGYTNEDEVHISVSNVCAKAISQEEVQLFFQSGYSTKPSEDGKHSGLGLAIIQSLAGMYKGTVACDISKEQQIEFQVTIPV